MFPPMSPLTERIRVDLENKEFEREASLRAQMGDKTNLFSRVRCWLASLRLRSAITAPRPREVVSERQIASNSGGC